MVEAVGLHAEQSARPEARWHRRWQARRVGVAVFDIHCDIRSAGMAGAASIIFGLKILKFDIPTYEAIYATKQIFF